MANKRVSLWKYVKLTTGWRYCKPVIAKNNKLKPNAVMVKGKEQSHPEGAYYLHFYVGAKEKWQKLSEDPAEALRVFMLEKSTREAVAAGVPVDWEATLPQLKIDASIYSYLKELKLTSRPGTYELHRYTLKLFEGWCERRRENVADITRMDCLSFGQHLAEYHRNSPRSCSNKLLRVNQWIKKVLCLKAGEGPISVRDCNVGVVQTEPEVYTPVQLAKFFKACTPTQSLIFKTLLLSGMREEELKYLLWTDVDFTNGTLRVTAKPEFDYAIKDHEERTITVPMRLIESLKLHHETNKRRLVFCTKSGRPFGHLWEMCKAIAAKGKAGCQDVATCCMGCRRKPKKCELWYLHKFRATYATELLREGYDIVSVRKLLGHKPGSEATFRYLAPLHGTGLREKGLDQLFAGV